LQVQKAKPGCKLVKSLFKKYEEIPKDWNIQIFQDYVFLKHGYAFDSNDFIDGDGIKVIKIGEMQSNGTVNFSKAEKISFKNADKYKEFIIKKEDILMALTGATLGKTSIITTNEQLLQNQRVGNIFPISEKILDKKYLFFILRSKFIQNQIWSFVTALAQPNIGKSELNKIKFHIPNMITEQQKIASILSNVNNLINSFDNIIESTKKLKKGMMHQLLTKGIGHKKFKEINFHFGKIINIPEIWKLGKLRKYTLKIGSGITPRGGSKSYKTSGIPLIRSQNVHFDGLKLDDVAFIPKEIHENMKNTKLDVHDVLLNITGASIGRCTYVPDHLKEGNVNQHVCIIRPKKDVDYRFLTHLLSTKFMQDIINSSQAGLSRQGLNFEEIGNFLIPIPHIDEQKEITFILNNMSSRINHLESTKSSLQILKKGLMQKLLTGQLRV